MNMNLKRPLCIFCVSFIAGILILNSMGMSFFLLSAALYLMCIAFMFKKIKNSILLFLITLLFFGAGGIIFNNAEKTYMGTFKEYYDKPVKIEGFIDSEIENSGDRVKFTLRTERIIYQQSAKRVRGNLFVYIYTVDGSRFAGNEAGYRSRVSIGAVIDEPKPATNPGGFNYRRYLASIGISGTVYLKNPYDIEKTGIKGGGWINKLGYKIKNTVLGIVEYSLDKNQAGLLEGMIIGYKDGLDETAFEAFSKAGLTHIMVASGMNVAFIILPLTFIFKKLRLGNLAANGLTILVLVLFVFVAGFSASVVRAVIMGIVILTGRIIRRETDIYTSIAIAVFILLAINPFTLFDIGFQLSFAATLSLVLFYPKIKGAVTNKYIPDLVADTLAATLAAQAGVIPVTLYYFNNLSLISVLSNLLVVPLVQFITIIGFAMVFAGLVNIHGAVLIGYVNNSFLSFVLFVTETTAKIPYALLKLPTPPLILITVYYLVLLYWLKRSVIKEKIPAVRHLKWVLPGILALVLLISFAVPKPLEITFLDVGQGDGAFIKTSHGTKVLIDGGGRNAGSKSSFDIGESVMVPYILDRGTKHIDIVIATHGHSDHTEGLEAVLKEMDVGTVILPDTDGEGFEKIVNICSEKKIQIVECRQGDIIKLDSETDFLVLNPQKFEEDSLAQQSLNDSSLMLKLTYRNVKVLFTGDCELPVEQRALELGLDVDADMLKVGHHGSSTSTSEAFLERVSPEYAVISVGENNNFGHPSQFVVDRIEERGIRLFRTDERGAVTATTYGQKLRIRTMLPG